MFPCSLRPWGDPRLCIFYLTPFILLSRFPHLLPILDPEWAAEKIVDAVLRNQRVVFIPKILNLFVFLKGILPTSTYHAMGDFFGINSSMDEFKGRANTSKLIYTMHEWIVALVNPFPRTFHLDNMKALETISFLFVQTYVVLCFVIYNSDKSVIVTPKESTVYIWIVNVSQIYFKFSYLEMSFVIHLLRQGRRQLFHSLKACKKFKCRSKFTRHIRPLKVRWPTSLKAVYTPARVYAIKTFIPRKKKKAFITERRFLFQKNKRNLLYRKNARKGFEAFFKRIPGATFVNFES